MQYIKIAFASLITLCLTSFALHDYFVATYDVNLSKDEKSIQMSIKLITHDVEEALVTENHPFLNLRSKNEYQNVDSVLNVYFKDHLQFTINSTPVSYKFIGHEAELDEDLWVYLELPIESKVESISIFNSVLTQVFEGQQNIMHFKLGEYSESIIFTHSKNEQDIKL